MVADAELPRLDGTAAGDPHRWTRLLDRPRPHVDVPQLRVLAVEGEGFALFPGPGDEVDTLAVLLAQDRGRRAVAEVRVHRRADGEPGDEASAGQNIEHRELLCDARRRVVQRDGVAHHDDLRLLGFAGHDRRHEVRRRHQTVGVLVVLVDADAVEAELVGVHQLVEVGVVDLVALHGVVVVDRDVDPDRAHLLPEVVRQVRIRHEMEEMELHALNLPGESATRTFPYRRPRTPTRSGVPRRERLWVDAGCIDRFARTFGFHLARQRQRV